MFAAWATARITLWLHMGGDALLKFVTDVEIHSLGFRWGWDLAALLILGSIAAIVQKVRQRPVFVPATVATLLATALSIAMVLVPALTLSGRVSSPFTGVTRAFRESVSFALVVTLALIGLIAVLGRRTRSG